MNRSTLILTIALPVACAAAAAAQLTSVRFAAPINPIAGLPKALPSPLTGPLAGTGISLPTPLPSLTPSLTLAPAPAERSRDGVVNPLRIVMPGVVIRFADQDKPAGTLPDASKEKLDEAFDGENRPGNPSVDLPRREPVSSGRRIGLPEDDLMRELGF